MVRFSFVIKRDTKGENVPAGVDKFVKFKDTGVIVQKRRASLRAETYQQG